MGCKFRRQHQIGSYVVDFCCIEKNLIVEIDGGQHAEQKVYDTERTLRLASEGYRVIRFWNHEVLNLTESVLEKIRLVLDPHPNPLPARERGKQ